MRLGRRATIWGVLLAMTLAGGAMPRVLRADPPPLLSGDEVKKLVDAGQYQDALKALVRIMDLKGAAAAPYDRYDMLMLRAECQLQLKLRDAVLATLETVRKEAVEASNDDHAAHAIGLVLLIQKSPLYNYTPKTGPAALRKPIPILDRILRKSAYDALFADEYAPLEVKVTAALKATSLPPIADAAKAASGVRAVELASTGDNKKTEKITQDLTRQALKLMNGALADLTSTTQRISDSANRLITENVTMQDGAGHTYYVQQTHRQGLMGQDAQTLKSIEATCDKMGPAAAELSRDLGGDAAPFKQVASKAQTLKAKADTTLTDNYLSQLR